MENFPIFARRSVSIVILSQGKELDRYRIEEYEECLALINRIGLEAFQVLTLQQGEWIQL